MKRRVLPLLTAVGTAACGGSPSESLESSSDGSTGEDVVGASDAPVGPIGDVGSPGSGVVKDAGHEAQGSAEEDASTRGTYVEVEHDGTRVLSYEDRDGQYGVRDVLETLVTFEVVDGADVDRAVEWLSRPSCWRRSRPAGRRVRAVLEFAERLRVVAGAPTG